MKPQVSAHVAIDLEGGSGPAGIIDEADWKYISRREPVASEHTASAQRTEEPA